MQDGCSAVQFKVRLQSCANFKKYENMVKKQTLTEMDQEPKRRPYGAKVEFLLGEDIQLSLDGPVCLLVSDDTVVQLELAPEQPLGSLSYLKKYRASIEGFATASEGETAGIKLSLALLWAAVSRPFTLRLDYHTPLPCIVYDRTASSGGMSMREHLSVCRRVNAGDLAELMQDVMSTSVSADRHLLMSMELFAAARLEMTERAKFVSLVSSLEPLAAPADYPRSITNLVQNYLKQLQAASIPELSEEDTSGIKKSLNGRLRELEHESIRQALLRTVRELLPFDSNALKVIDEAYALRSTMLHEGVTDPYLDRRTHVVEGIIRKMFAARIGKPLKIPVVSE